MNWKFASAWFASICLVMGGWIAIGAMANTQTKPVVFTTTPKAVSASLQLNDGSSFAISGRASLTVTAANENDTLTGTLVYTLPDNARQKIATTTGKPLKDIPGSVQLKDVSANFRHGTACPLVRLEISVKDAALNVAGGARLQLDHAVLDIHETPEQMNQLFCNWTRQINAKRQRRGIIAALNRLIQPEGQQEDER
ncbi:MAG: hypothetical protein ABI977_07095 [Acidobacteriota bacterium]